MRTSAVIGSVVMVAIVMGGAGYALGARAASPPPAPQAGVGPAPREARTPDVHHPAAPAPAALPAAPRSTPPLPEATPQRRSEIGRQDAVPAAGPLRVRRLVVTHAIEDREPVDELGAVEADADRVYGFVEVSNPGDEERTIEVTFEGEGRRVGLVELTVPARSPRYRTWAWTRGARRVGSWQVVVRDEQGRDLCRNAFRVL